MIQYFAPRPLAMIEHSEDFLSRSQGAPNVAIDRDLAVAGFNGPDDDGWYNATIPTFDEENVRQILAQINNCGTDEIQLWFIS